MTDEQKTEQTIQQLRWDLKEAVDLCKAVCYGEGFQFESKRLDVIMERHPDVFAVEE